MKRVLYIELASIVDAMHRCRLWVVNNHCGNGLHYAAMAEMHEQRAIDLCKEFMPSGSGFDAGTEFYMNRSTGDKLVFGTSFHHMDDAGGYHRWTDHAVTVRPSLVHGFTLTVSGRNWNDIKDYISDTFRAALSTEIVEDKPCAK